MTMIKKEEQPSPALEINLISAQGLKIPTTLGRRVQTYALAWVDPATKLRTGIDKVGGENPTWNDRFLFRVTSDFLSGETSGVYVEVYAVGRIRDSLIGSVRFLIGNFLDVRSKTPSFTALQIRRPSGSFHGVLNVGAMVISSSDLLAKKTAVGYRDLMAESVRRHGRRDRRKEQENLGVDSLDLSDSDETSSSSSNASTALKDFNTIRDLASTRPTQCTGFLCGLLLQREVAQIKLRPLDLDHDDGDDDGDQKKKKKVIVVGDRGVRGSQEKQR